MAYDRTQRYITVSVTDPGNGILAAEIAEITKVTAENPTGEEAETVVFNNEHTAKGTFSLNGTKVLTGSQTDRRIKSGEFTFQLWSATIDSGSWNEDELIATTTNNVQIDGQALFTFDSDSVEQLTFTQAGEYLFIVKEAQGTNLISEKTTVPLMR